MKTKPLVLLTLALLPSFFTPANADLKDGLVAHWSFDDCTAKDNSGNGHDGQIYGNPQCVDGAVNKGFQFNGNGDYIEVPDSVDLRLAGSYTLSGWALQKNYDEYASMIISKRLTDGNGYIWAFDGKFTQAVDPLGSASMSVIPSSGDYHYIDSNVKTPLNTWQYITVIYDANTKVAKTYVNGKETNWYVQTGGSFDKKNSLEPLPTPSILNTSVLRIGESTIPCCGYYMDGILDDLRIYNRALSESEITELYKNPTGTQTQVFEPSYTLSQPLDSIFNATDGSEQMDGTVFGQCVYGGYCARTSLTTAHNGVDYMVAKRTPVYAICDGTIKNVAKGGNILNRFTVIDHSNCGGLDKLYAYYGHIDPTVKKGAKVEAGQQIGTVADWQANSHLHLSLSKNYVTSGWGYTPVGKSTPKDCKKESVVARRQLLDAKGWLDPIEIGMKSDWNSVLLKGGTAKTGCNAPEQVYTDKTLPYSPWK